MPHFSMHSNGAWTLACAPQGIRFASSTVFDRKALQHNSKHIKQALQGRDVVFYQAPNGVNRTFRLLYISAGVQLLFWQVPCAAVT